MNSTIGCTMGAPGQFNLGRESCQLEETLIEMNLNNKRCEACNEPLDPTMKILQCDGLYFHEECFVCSQCFQEIDNLDLDYNQSI